jgi:hypothetical protein
MQRHQVESMPCQLNLISLRIRCARHGGADSRCQAGGPAAGPGRGLSQHGGGPGAAAAPAARPDAGLRLGVGPRPGR